MPDANHQTFLRNYTKALRENTASVFVGAGFLRPSGFVDWKTLLKDVAEDLALDVESPLLVASSEEQG